MKEKEKMIIIGNKPYFNFKLDSIIDSFGRNVRCNMSIPNLNNGTKCDKIPSVSKFHNMFDTMDTADVVANKIIKNLHLINTQPSGAFSDLRNIN
tara:strand:+ start:104 stop:388 length:285 start_codon:yes stop_codon:yes gene_type:complete